MGELISKISSYNIFNYLLPGVLFAAYCELYTNHALLQEDIVVGAFVYYFIGLVISRFGSLVIHPFLDWINFVSFSPYAQYVFASKKDPKIDELSEVNNMYRTLISLLVSILLLTVVDALTAYFSVSGELVRWITLLGLLGLFVLSYRKQSKYIVSRIEAANKE